MTDQTAGKNEHSRTASTNFYTPSVDLSRGITHRGIDAEGLFERRFELQRWNGSSIEPEHQAS